MIPGPTLTMTLMMSMKGYLQGDTETRRTTGWGPAFRRAGPFAGMKGLPLSRRT